MGRHYITALVMKSIYEVLRHKECDAELVRQQIAALRQAIPLLVNTAASPQSPPSPPTPQQVAKWKDALRLAAPLLADEADDFVSNLRDRRIESPTWETWRPLLVLKRMALSSLRHKNRGTCDAE